MDGTILATTLGGLVQSGNVLISLVSWTLIHPLWGTFFYEDGAWTSDSAIEWRLSRIYMHTFPLIYSTINMFVLSDAIVHSYDIWLIGLLGAVYLASNYWYYLASGTVTYEFLPWNDLNGDTTILFGFMAASIVSTVLSYLSFAWSTQGLFGRWESDLVW